MQYDTIVIGAGHNGLAAATLLAKAGQSVLVLEKGAQPGGAVGVTTFKDGNSVPRYAHSSIALGRQEIADLGLSRHGLTGREAPLSTLLLSDDGRHVFLDGASVAYADGSAHPDAASFAALRNRLSRFADKLAPLMTAPPPQLEGGDWREMVGLAGLAFGIRRLGAVDSREFMRVLLSNVYDTVLDEMDDSPLAALLGVDAILGGRQGPRAPGTVLTLLQRLRNGGNRIVPKGGMGTVASAFVEAAREAGVTVRCHAGVAAVLSEDDRVTGVETDGGERITCGRVLSSLDPMTTMRLTGVGQFDAEDVRRVRKIRTRGAAAKVNLSLSAMPNFTGASEKQAAGRILTAQGLGDLELTYNAVKYGEMPETPIMEIVLPGRRDADMGATLSAIVQYVPYDLEGGWTASAKKTLESRVLDRLEKFAPGLTASVQEAEVLTPVDIETETGAPGGHWHHGELIADQMLMLRPVPGMDRYEMPVSGMYLCGASTHPGGDVTGLPGCNAARQVLKGLKKRAAA